MLVPGLRIKYILPLFFGKCGFLILLNILHKRFRQISLAPIRRSVALKTEALIQCRRQHKYTFIIPDNHLTLLVFSMLQMHPVKVRLHMPDFHIIFLRRLPRIKHHLRLRFITFSLLHLVHQILSRLLPRLLTAHSKHHH